MDYKKLNVERCHKFTWVAIIRYTFRWECEGMTCKFIILCSQKWVFRSNKIINKIKLTYDKSKKKTMGWIITVAIYWQCKFC